MKIERRKIRNEAKAIKKERKKVLSFLRGLPKLKFLPGKPYDHKSQINWQHRGLMYASCSYILGKRNFVVLKNFLKVRGSNSNLNGFEIVILYKFSASLPVVAII